MDKTDLYALYSGRSRQGREQTFNLGRIEETALTVNSKYLAVAGRRPVSLWEQHTGGAIIMRGVIDVWASALAFHPNHKALTMALQDGSLLTVDRVKHAELWRAEPDIGEIRRIAWLADGKQLVAAGEEGLVRVAVSGGRKRTVETQRIANITAVGMALFASGERLLVGTRTGDIVLMDLDGNELSNIKAHRRPVHYLAVSDDEQFAVTSSESGDDGEDDNDLHIWSVTGEVVKHATLSVGPEAVAFQPGTHRFAYGTFRHGVVYLGDADVGREICALVSHDDMRPDHLYFLGKKGKVLLSGSLQNGDWRATEVTVRGGRVAASRTDGFCESTGRFRECLPGERYIVEYEQDGLLGARKWSANGNDSSVVSRWCDGPLNTVMIDEWHALELTPEGVATHTGTLTGQVWQELAIANAACVAANRRLNLGAVATEGGRIVLWRVSGSSTDRIGSFKCAVKTWRQLVLASADVLYGLDDQGRLMRVFSHGATPAFEPTTNDSALVQLRIAPDGKHLATLNAGGDLQVWSCSESGVAELAACRRRGKKCAHEDLAFSADGTLVAAPLNKELIVLEVASGDIRATAPLKDNCLGLALIGGGGLGALVGTPGKITFVDLS